MSRENMARKLRKDRNRKPAEGPASGSQDPSGPKTTRPEANVRRPLVETRQSETSLQRTFDAVPDRVDLRDWIYQPSLAALPDQLINCYSVPDVLDQGTEGACTGFALAAVINYLLAQRNIRDRYVSPWMLY